MSARETILSRIAGAGRPPAPRASYGPPALADPAASFRAKARASHAEVHEIGGAAEVPEAALAILSGAGAALRLHLPGNSPLRALPWHRAPELVLDDAPPGGEDAALSAADYAIAETGTLAFLSGAARPSSWHFLPGREHGREGLPFLSVLFKARFQILKTPRFRANFSQLPVYRPDILVGACDILKQWNH